MSSLFSKEQRAFYKAHAPAGLSLDSLSVLGPTFVLKAKHQPKEFDRRIVVEMWLYPDGSRILEVSTKGLPAEAFQVGATFKAYLTKLGHLARRTAGDENQGCAGFLQGQSRVNPGGVVVYRRRCDEIWMGDRRNP